LFLTSTSSARRCAAQKSAGPPLLPNRRALGQPSAMHEAPKMRKMSWACLC
jgi:hypothetical protein